VIQNESAPDSFESWDARRTALPRSLLTTSLRPDLHCGNGSDVYVAALRGYSLGRGKAQSLFFVHIRLLGEPLTPEMLSRLQACSPDLLLRRLVASSDPSDSKSRLRTAVLNYKLVPNFNLASVTTQPHAMVGDIESMREMALLTPSDPETHWHNRFGSLRPPSSCTKFHAHSE
jgi:hypothetical protein